MFDVILPFLLLITSTAAALFGFMYFLTARNLKKTALEKLRLAELNTKQQNEIEKQNSMIHDLTKLQSHCPDTGAQKSEVFCNVIHELKTPLCVILGAIQLIEQKKCLPPADDSNTQKHFQTIRQNCFKLLRLICNILDITRLESGYADLNACDRNVTCLVQEIAQSVMPYASQKNLRIVFEADKEEIITAIDSEKMERIIMNLLSNAIKFSPEGGEIRLGIWREGKKVFISVRDEGPGIPAEKQKSVFERFRQVNGFLTRPSEGAGIGLSLVKAFTELHNGTIRLKSEEGKGSEFIVEIPYRRLNREPTAVPPAGLYRDKKKDMLHMEFSHLPL